ncbi:hypothetical protein JCM8547_008501 [Rhodosporidiobolus lusitaniae]
MAWFRIAALSTAAGAAGLAYVASVEPTRDRSTSSTSTRPVDPDAVRSRLAIYSRAEHPAVLVPEKSPLQDEVAVARLASADTLRAVIDKAQAGKDRWLHWESKAEGSLRSIVSSQDQLSPNVIYVAVATLAGSIVGRNRGLLLRLSLPPTFLLLATLHFLPHTWANLTERAERFEEGNLPQVKEWRQRVVGSRQ